jgi:hypothetical protein
MNVQELIALLKRMPLGATVVLQKDAEGNGYSPLSDVREGRYRAKTSWAGEWYDTGEWTPDDAFTAVVLEPTN